MRWQRAGGIARFELHAARLRASAEYFGFECPGLAGLRDAVAAAGGIQSLEAKVRLLLSRDGTLACEYHAIDPLPDVLNVALADQPVASNDVFLFHKTTRRETYRRARASAPRADSVLLWNERGEVTEAAEANVVVELGGRRLTPPVWCGLLPGVLRAELLQRQEIEEGVIQRDDLRRAARIWLISSLRGWMPAVLEP
jgi:branched-subunit amino acid aminotransferase/4-amino-4-deoxychorismate lyase